MAADTKRLILQADTARRHSLHRKVSLHDHLSPQRLTYASSGLLKGVWSCNQITGA
jgi:hypothetical protein